MKKFKQLIELIRKYHGLFRMLEFLFVIIALSGLIFFKNIPHPAVVIIVAILLAISLFCIVLEKKAFPENKFNWRENIELSIMFILFIICGSFSIIGVITPPPFNSFFTTIGDLAFWGVIISAIITIIITIKKSVKNSPEST